MNPFTEGSPESPARKAARMRMTTKSARAY
jgi:hypothetical protein